MCCNRFRVQRSTQHCTSVNPMLKLIASGPLFHASSLYGVSVCCGIWFNNKMENTLVVKRHWLHVTSQSAVERAETTMKCDEKLNDLTIINIENSKLKVADNIETNPFEKSYNERHN